MVSLASLAVQEGICGEAGTAAANYLKIASGARPEGMAEAFSAISGDPQCLFFNPAGLASLRGAKLAFSRVPYLVDTSIHALSLVQDIRGQGVLGLGVAALDGGLTPRNGEDAGGNYVQGSGDFSFLAMNLSMVAARRFSSPKRFGFLDLGLGLRTSVQENDSHAAHAFSGDVGALWVSDSERTRAGAVVQNIGGQLGGARQPLGGRAGLSQDWKLAGGSLTGALEGLGHVDSNVKLNLGLEWNRGLGRIHNLALRAGYRFNQDLGGLAGLSTGLGYALRDGRWDAGLDWSFSPQGILGSVHRISLSVGLGAGPRRGAGQTQSAGSSTVPADQAPSPVPSPSAEAPAPAQPAPAAAPLDPDQAMKAGLEAYNAKDYGAAASSFETVLKARPDDSAAHRSLATSYFQLGRREEALKEFEEALRLAPDDASLRNFVGRLKALLNKGAEAQP